MDEKVNIVKMSTAGTAESNDILIMLTKGDGGIEIELDSVVQEQYGDDIKKLIYDTLVEEKVSNAKVIAKDKGALDFTIRARVKTCIRRGSGDANEL